MKVETNSQEVIIKIPNTGDTGYINQFVQYFKAMELAQKAKGTEEEASQLAEEAMTEWWAKNGNNFLK